MEANGSLQTSIIIIGAGASGLAIAQGLKKIGVASIVFERKDCLLPPGHRDWNLGTHWGFPYLQRLISQDACDRLQQIEVDPHVPIKEEDSLQFVHGATGEVIAASPVSNFHRLQRHKLRELLAEGIDIRFNKTFVDMEMVDSSGEGAKHGVLARFEDGTTVSGKLLIGADGSRSIIRQKLLGPQHSALHDLPWSSTWAQVKYPAERALYLRKWHELYCAAAHPNSSFAFLGLHDVPDPEKPEGWTFFFYITWPWKAEDKLPDWDDAARLQHFKDIAKDWADPLHSAVDWLPEGHSVWHSRFAEWDPDMEEHKWDNSDGRVTLAGDAAHTMTYSRGQGLNHSLKDAVDLVEAIERFLGETGNNKGVQKDAIDSYEAEMVARAGLEVRTSTLATYMQHDWEKFMQSPLVTMGLKQSNASNTK